MTIYGEGPITIKHEPGFQTVNYGGYDYGIIPPMYLLGWMKPNFPVPAIPLEVLFFEDEITIRKAFYKKRLAHWYRK